ncbi:MAG: hypothetical protein M9894_35895 [Planctomycetes bacterium]|nr:hypothetical protein [Planctomycetota bacterium]
MSDDAPSYFHDAEVEHEGRTVRLPVADARTVQSRGNYWHGPGDPSTWLAEALFSHVRARLGLPDLAALTLAARSLGITVEALRGKIEWHENYMRWHDGDQDYRVL